MTFLVHAILIAYSQQSLAIATWSLHFILVVDLFIFFLYIADNIRIRTAIVKFKTSANFSAF